MANADRRVAARRNVNRNSRGMYVDGNTVRRLQESPARPYPAQAQPARKRRPDAAVDSRKAAENRRLSVQAQKNREKAKSMSPGFVLFLAAVSVAVLFVCIHYLQLKSEITSSMKNVASLEAELTELREDNDAYESQVTSSVDLNRIKKIAIGSLGMKYPSEDQIVTYTTARSSYVRQYQDIPETK